MAVNYISPPLPSHIIQWYNNLISQGLVIKDVAITIVSLFTYIDRRCTRFKETQTYKLLRDRLTTGGEKTSQFGLTSFSIKRLHLLYGYTFSYLLLSDALEETKYDYSSYLLKFMIEKHDINIIRVLFSAYKHLTGLNIMLAQHPIEQKTILQSVMTHNRIDVMLFIFEQSHPKDIEVMRKSFNIFRLSIPFSKIFNLCASNNDDIVKVKKLIFYDRLLYECVMTANNSDSYIRALCRTLMVTKCIKADIDTNEFLSELLRLWLIFGDKLIRQLMEHIVNDIGKQSMETLLTRFPAKAISDMICIISLFVDDPYKFYCSRFTSENEPIVCGVFRHLLNDFHSCLPDCIKLLSFAKTTQQARDMINCVDNRGESVLEMLSSTNVYHSECREVIMAYLAHDINSKELEHLLNRFRVYGY